MGEIKSDNKEIKMNIMQMNSKISTIETKQKENKEKTNADINDLRDEMKANNREINEIKSVMKNKNEELEKKLTENVVETLKPKIRDIEIHSKTDLRNLIR